MYQNAQYYSSFTGTGLISLGVLTAIGTGLFLKNDSDFAITSVYDHVSPETIAELQDERIPLIAGISVGIGCAIAIPGVIILAQSTDDEAIHDAYFAQKDAIQSRHANAYDTIQRMAESARSRRHTLASIFLGLSVFYAASSTFFVFNPLFHGHNPEYQYHHMIGGGISTLLFGSFAIWQYRTTWYAEDVWDALRNTGSLPPQTESLRWTLAPSFSAENVFLNFALIY